MRLVAVLFVSFCLIANAVTYEQEFVNFVRNHSKAYASVAETRLRFGVFKSNMDMINNHNSQNLGWTMALNEFADLTWDEFASTHLGYVPSTRTTVILDEEVNVQAAPASIDWTTKNAVSEVKNQGNCGGCWSFSTTGSIEGAVEIKTGVLTSLSEQQLVDCSTQNSGCNGGSMDLAFAFVIKNGGLCRESAYPFTGVDGRCKTCTAVSKISSYKDVTQNSEDALTAAVANGPVSVAIQANQNGFQFYKSGVMTSRCGTKLDHGVLAVGYGVDGGTQYWKIKNSWGATWGENGFIRIGRGMQAPYGLCGIAMQASYAIA